MAGTFESVSELREDEEVGLDVAKCIPYWVFFALFQPLISIMFWVHGFARLNLAIERDVDQDIVEMNIRLTYSESPVPNWLLQQMVCLERLDGRALSLPFDLIPELSTSKNMISGMATGLLFLGPFLLSIANDLTAEYLCRNEYAE